MDAPIIELQTPGRPVTSWSTTFRIGWRLGPLCQRYVFRGISIPSHNLITRQKSVAAPVGLNLISHWVYAPTWSIMGCWWK